MGYYDDKREAYQLIDQMASEGKSVEQITYKVQLRYGFGPKMVRDTLTLRESITQPTTG